MTSTDLARNVEAIEIAAMADLLASATSEQRAMLGIGAHHTSAGLASVVASCDVLAFNRVLGIGQTAAAAGDIEHLIDLYRQAGVPRAFMQVNPVTAEHDLFETLRAANLRHYNNWVKLYRDTRPVRPVRSDLEIRIIDESWAAAFARIVTRCFDWPAHLQPWLAATVGRAGWTHYMAFEGDRPVGTAAMYVEGEWCWIDFAATDEAYRGRGAQGKLLEHRIKDAARAGCRYVSVETAEETPAKPAPSYRNMVRYGFEVAFVRPNYIWTAARTDPS
jgi:GNAT superfamily N-acetyltransferase